MVKPSRGVNSGDDGGVHRLSAIETVTGELAALAL